MNAQITEQVVPMIDKYNIAKLTAAGTAVTKAITASDIFATFLDLRTRQTNAFVPHSSCVVFVPASKFAHLQASFARSSNAENS